MEGLQKKNKKRKKEKKHINNDDLSFDLFQDPFNINETTPTTTNSGLNPNTMMQICGEMSLSDLGELEAISNFPTLGLTLPIFRTGKWYYEVEIITSGIMQVFKYIYQIGWADNDFVCNEGQNNGIGDDIHSWGYDGGRQLKFHGEEPEKYAIDVKWKTGDIISCYYDGDHKEISYSLNGVSLGVAFSDIKISSCIYPAISIECGEKIRVNLGQRAFKYPPFSDYEDIWHISQSVQQDIDQNEEIK